MKCLLERVLRRLISNRSQNIVEKTFQRIASSAHLQLLRDGLRLFLLHFLKRKSQPNVDDVANDDEFRQRLKLAENILMSAASWWLLFQYFVLVVCCMVFLKPSFHPTQRRALAYFTDAGDTRTVCSECKPHNRQNSGVYYCIVSVVFVLLGRS